MTMRLCIGPKDLKFFQLAEPQQTALRSRYRHWFNTDSTQYTRLDVAVLRGQVDAYAARKLLAAVWFRDLHLELHESEGQEGMCPTIWMLLETYIAPSVRKGCWYVRARRTLFENRDLEITHDGSTWIRLGTI